MDKYLQEQFIGKTFTEKLNDEMADYFSERKFSVLGYLPRPGAIAMVHTLEDGAIKALGASDPFDIINNNFGKWLAAMHAPVTNGGSFGEIGGGVDPLDITNTTRGGIFFYSTDARAYQGLSAGQSQIQIGSGSTTPTVSDFDIETAFSSGPESVRQTLVVNSGYASGIGRVASGVNIGPTVNAGTVNELAIFMVWLQFGTGNFTFILSHDAISPGVAFTPAQTIFAQYFFQL